MNIVHVMRGLERSRRLAESMVELIRHAEAEIGCDEEHADWPEADASISLARGELLKLAAVTVGQPDPTSLTLHDVHHEVMRRAVDAADPDGERG